MPGVNFKAPGLDAPRYPGSKEQKQVQAMLDSLAAQVAEMHPDTMRKLLPVLIDAKKDLQKGIYEWMTDHGMDAGARFTAAEYRRVMLSLNQSIKTITKIQPELNRILAEAGVMSGHLATEHLAFEVSRMANIFGTPSVFAMVPPQIDTAAIITDAKRELIPRFRTSAARYVGNVRDDIRRQFGVGLARGETFHQLTNRLQRLGGPRGVVSLRGVIGDPRAISEHIAEGLFRRYRHWGERLVRTEVMNAYNVQHAASIDELNDDLDEDESAFLKRWDGTLDRICPICTALDGQAVPTGKPFIGPGGTKFDHAPAHPNCRCTVVAWHPSWGDMKGEAAPSSQPYKIKAKPKKPKPRPAPERKKPEPKAKPRKRQAAPKPAPPNEIENVNAEMAGAAIGKRGQSSWPGLSQARQALDRDFTGRGMHRQAERMSPKDSNVRLESSSKWGGIHNLATGEITLTPKSARGGRAFAKGYAKDPAKTRADVLAGAKEIQQFADTMDELDIKYKVAKARGRVLRFKPGTPERIAADKIVADYTEIRARAIAQQDAIKTSKAVKAYKQSEGMSALYHETIHGYGPGTIRGLSPGRIGRTKGLIVEEISTEMLARGEMIKNYGIAREAYAAKGSYSGWIDPMVDHVAELYGVQDLAAREIVERASLAYKKIAKADDLALAFARSFPKKAGKALTEAELRGITVQLAIIAGKSP